MPPERRELSQSIEWCSNDETEYVADDFNAKPIKWRWMRTLSPVYRSRSGLVEWGADELHPVVLPRDETRRVEMSNSTQPPRSETVETSTSSFWSRSGIVVPSFPDQCQPIRFCRACCKTLRGQNGRIAHSSHCN